MADIDNFPNQVSSDLSSDLITYYNLLHKDQRPFKGINDGTYFYLESGVRSSSILAKLKNACYGYNELVWPSQLSMQLFHRIVKELRFGIKRGQASWLFDHQRTLYLIDSSKRKRVLGYMLKPYVRSHPDWPVERDDYIRKYQRLAALAALLNGTYTNNIEELDDMWSTTINQGFIATPDDLASAGGYATPTAGSMQFIWIKNFKMDLLMHSSCEYLKRYFVAPLDPVVLQEQNDFRLMARDEEHEYLSHN